MILLPIDIDETKNASFHSNPECAEILQVYPGYYQQVGYNKPWIGYFFTRDGSEVLGCGGFKGKPKNGSIEIAYGTFKNHKGKGIGTEICRQLVLLSLETDPALQIRARTLPEENASTKILKRNGFVCTGMVVDEDDGDVWEWEWRK
ncbi:MAG: GNAT family N-acetyltransferase [Chitinophagales bacterium]|nr:GNAT family N-acetyltransferase [Chitinophagales bacterium]